MLKCSFGVVSFDLADMAQVNYEVLGKGRDIAWKWPFLRLNVGHLVF